MQIGYLIPVNGDIKEPTLTGIPMDEIFRICQSKSKHMLFLMDACYSGLMAASKGVKILEEKGVNYIYSVANKSARQIITAGTAEQEVWEGAEWEEHGIFTLNILKALDNWEADNNYEDGYITATELGQYLKINVSNATDNNQTPQVKRIKYSKGGEFIFTRNP